MASTPISKSPFLTKKKLALTLKNFNSEHEYSLLFDLFTKYVYFSAETRSDGQKIFHRGSLQTLMKKSDVSWDFFPKSISDQYLISEKIGQVLILFKKNSSQ